MPRQELYTPKGKTKFRRRLNDSLCTIKGRLQAQQTQSTAPWHIKQRLICRVPSSRMMPDGPRVHHAVNCASDDASYTQDGVVLTFQGNPEVKDRCNHVELEADNSM
jgi:hypothetical protein